MTKEKDALDSILNTAPQARLSTQQSEQQAEAERLKEEINTMEKAEIFRQLGIQKDSLLKRF